MNGHHPLNFKPEPVKTTLLCLEPIRCCFLNLRRAHPDVLLSERWCLEHCERFRCPHYFAIPSDIAGGLPFTHDSQVPKEPITLVELRGDDPGSFRRDKS